MDRINIRPGVSILSVLPHLNYKPWYALAEFVDNALQSYLTRKRELREMEGRNFVLSVDINIDQAAQQIRISDNAGGIEGADFARAFRPAEAPPDASGLSEFGMGMKSAAAWFAPKWIVRTKALGETVERTVKFDIGEIVTNSIEELDVVSRRVPADRHYTEIVLDCVRRMPQTRTLAKIVDHLSSIYRCFTRSGELRLTFDGEPLLFEEPEVLIAPPWRTRDAKPFLWRKEVSIQLDGKRRAEGFIAIRAKGSTARAGLALLRRNRLIEGSADETYRPSEIFGAANSFAYQRIFGELSLIGFAVSHTKDGIRWDESEEELVRKLRRELSSAKMNILDQAQNWRSTETGRENRPTAEKAVRQMKQDVEPETLGVALGQVQASHEGQQEKPAEQPRKTPLVEREDDVLQTFALDVAGGRWEIDLALDYQDATADWMRISDQPTDAGSRPRRLGIRLAMLHPFTQRYFGNAGVLETQGLARLAVGLVLAETIARDGGVRLAGRVRTSLNELLRLGLAL